MREGDFQLEAKHTFMKSQKSQSEKMWQLKDMKQQEVTPEGSGIFINWYDQVGTSTMEETGDCPAEAGLWMQGPVWVKPEET